MADALGYGLPRTEIVRLSSTDLDHTRSLLNRFYYPVAVGAPNGPAGFAFELHVIRLGPLTVGELSFRTPVTVTATEMNGYHVTLPVVGSVLTRQAGYEVIAGPDKAAVFRPGHPVYSLHAARSSELDIKIDRCALDAELEGLLGRPIDGPIDLAPTLSPGFGPGQSWSRLVLLVRDELDHPQSLIQHPLIAEQIRHSVLCGLLLCLPHRFHGELTAPARPGPPRAIRRALDAIHDEPERAFSVTDLAAEAGMSVRSLQEGFRRHVGCAPMAYVQQVRLGCAHDALRGGDPHRVTVASVAHRWGFAHLGRFASTYRKRFGVAPSETLRDGL